MTAVGFEPTPLRTGALSQRLRPLGQTVGMKTYTADALNGTVYPTKTFSEKRFTHQKGRRRI